MLVKVKQARGFYRVFIIKIRGGGVCTTGDVVVSKSME